MNNSERVLAKALPDHAASEWNVKVEFVIGAGVGVSVVTGKGKNTDRVKIRKVKKIWVDGVQDLVDTNSTVLVAGSLKEVGQAGSAEERSVRVT